MPSLADQHDPIRYTISSFPADNYICSIIGRNHFFRLVFLMSPQNEARLGRPTWKCLDFHDPCSKEDEDDSVVSNIEARQPMVVIDALRFQHADNQQVSGGSWQLWSYYQVWRVTHSKIKSACISCSRSVNRGGWQFNNILVLPTSTSA